MRKEVLSKLEIPNKNDLKLKNVLYCIENKITGDKYVGMTTKTFEHRLFQHLMMHSKKETSASENRTEFYVDLNNHGPEIFKAYVIKQNDDTPYLKSEEHRIRMEDKNCHRYAEKDLNRDHTQKRNYTKIICTSINTSEVLEFETQAECGRYFNCHRSNVIRALRGEYNLKRKWIVTYK